MCVRECDVWLIVCVLGNGLTGQARRVLPVVRVGSASEGGQLGKQPCLPEPWK